MAGPVSLCMISTSGCSMGALGSIYSPSRILLQDDGRVVPWQFQLVQAAWEWGSRCVSLCGVRRGSVGGVGGQALMLPCLPRHRQASRRTLTHEHHAIDVARIYPPWLLVRVH